MFKSFKGSKVFGLKINQKLPFISLFNPAAIGCLIYFLLSSFTFSQTHWVQKAGGALIDEGLDISMDAGGNSYATGYFTGTADFDNLTSISSYGSTDVFLAKYNPQGILQWVVKAGGNLPDKGIAVKTDAEGNSHLTGFFYGTANFGGTVITASGGTQDIFIAKYDTDGNFLWVTSAGGNGGDIGNGITVDTAGNVFITGEFSATAQFGSFSLTSMTNPNTSVPSIDIFIAKLDPSGNFLWVKKGSAKYTDRGLDIATDASGNVYATGQFSDTVSFDNTYNNNSFNAIFLVKYDSNGNEIWFRRAGGGIQNIAYGIAIDENKNVYLTGDAKGNVIFWGNTLTYLNTAFSNNIFVAKYDSDGTLLWATSNGSDSPVTARNIALDNSANPLVIGNFKCAFTEYSNAYGSGVFNSVGYNDIFVSKFSTSGNWQWARQFGGKQEDYGNGIAVDTSGLPAICGSFHAGINFPAGNNFLGYNISSVYSSAPNAYCSDQNYNKYISLQSSGNSDIIIGRAIDSNRQPYDYFNRTSGSCLRNFTSVCINSNCPDTIIACGVALLNANTNTSASVGPDFTYLWSPGADINSSKIAMQSGIYKVTVTTEDGCFSSADSIMVIIQPLPTKPTITDDEGININSTNPLPIYLCQPDSVVLTGGNFGSNTYFWSAPQGVTLNENPIIAAISGWYSFNVIDTNGCVNTNFIYIGFYPMLPPFQPEVMLLDDPDFNDSVVICKNDCFVLFLYDTVSNPDTNFICLPNGNPYNTYIFWSAVPGIPMNSNCDNGSKTYGNFCPDSSGTYFIEALIVRRNICDTDTFYLNTTIYAEVLPLPEVGTVSITITGDTVLCPGDSVLLVASSTGLTNYVWSNLSTEDSIYADITGTYSVSISDSNTVTGCTASSSAGVTVQVKPQPQIFANPSTALICPDSNITLTVNLIGQNYQWFGPFGQISDNAQTITVDNPGYYLCIVTDNDSCSLTSNTIEVKEYATPFLVVTPSDIVCPGGTATLTVVTNPGSILQWQSPLSGNSLFQIVNVTGTYTCNVTTCGITTAVSADITVSNTDFQFSANGPTTICDWDSVMISATSGLVSYNWSTGDSATDFIIVTQAGNYSLVAVDYLGCSFFSDTVVVSVNTSPEIPVSEDTTICSGDSAFLSAFGAGTIQWFDSSSGGNPIATGNNFTTSAIDSTANFFVQVSDGGICPSERIIVTVFVSIASLPVNLTSNSPLCSGDTLFLFSDSVNANYLWNGPDGFISSEINPQIPNISSAHSGQYVLTLSDAICTGNQNSISIIISPEINLSLNISNILCNGESNGTATVIPSGGTSPYLYLWNNSVEVQSIASLQPGNYSVTITDIYDCKTDTVINITEPQPLSANIISTDQECFTECDGTAFANVSGGTSAYSYQWNSAAVSDNATFSGFCVGDNSVKIIDENNCEFVEYFTINPSVFNPLPIQLSADDYVVIYGDSTMLHATVAAQGKINWSPSNSLSNSNSLNPFAMPSSTTTYIFQISDPANSLCFTTDTITIEVRELTCGEPEIFVPNAFTPNNDNQNDFIFVRGTKVKKMHFVILDRWGDKIFETENQSFGWDGTYKGMKCDPAVYVYYLTATCIDEQEFFKKGNITLIR